MRHDWVSRLLGPEIGPKEMGWFSRAWRVRVIGWLLEPWRLKKYARVYEERYEVGDWQWVAGELASALRRLAYSEGDGIGPVTHGALYILDALDAYDALKRLMSVPPANR